MNIDTTFLRRCTASLERAMEGIDRFSDDDVMHDVFRAACVKEFELVLDQSGKLLRKRLADWFASNEAADRLHFKDPFRHAAHHDLLAPDAVERWIRYRTTAIRRLTTTVRNSRRPRSICFLRLSRTPRPLADVIDRGNDG